jgi:hypothetical protein
MSAQFYPELAPLDPVTPDDHRVNDANDIERQSAIVFEIKRLISYLFDAKARQRITDAYLTGWITAEDALETMLVLDLLEHSPEALADG